MIKQKRNLKDETDLKITFKILHNNTKELVTLVTRSPSGHLFRVVCTFFWSRVVFGNRRMTRNQLFGKGK